MVVKFDMCQSGGGKSVGVLLNVRLSGPRWWTEDMEAVEVPATQIDASLTQTWLDATMNDADDGSANDKKKAETATGHSPPPETAKVVETLSDKLTKVVSKIWLWMVTEALGPHMPLTLGALAFVDGVLWLLALVSMTLSGRRVKYQLLPRACKQKLSITFCIKIETEGGAIPGTLNEFCKALQRESR